MNTDQIKQSHNIVEYINQYAPLKRAGNGEYSALCPFHSEKSPSFTVNEQKQFYYCFGCGATGDIIKFVEQYQGVEFIDACKILGGEADEMDVRTLSVNRARPMITYPKFDKRDAQKSLYFINKCDKTTFNNIDIYQYQGEWLAPIVDLDDEQIVNLYNVRNGKFLLGGISHRAGSIINRDKTKCFLICVDFDNATKLSKHNKDDNILIAYSAYNMKLIIENFNYNFIPVITADDTHAHSLTGTHDYLFFNGSEFIEKVRGEDYE